MTDILDSTVLRSMSLKQLKTHAKKLRKAGYPIKGYSKLTDSKQDMKLLRKMIRHAQKAGITGDVPEVETKAGPSCDLNFPNKTNCMKGAGNSAAQIRQLAEDCGIDLKKYKTKAKQCEQLLKMQGGPKVGAKGKASGITADPAYAKLKKKTAKVLKEEARQLGLTYAEQGGEMLPISKVRKHGVILAILKKKGKLPVPGVSPRKTSPRKTSPRKTPPRKTSPRKTPPRKTSPGKQCGSYRTDELMEMSLKELKNVMYSAGLKSGLPRSRKGKIDYLCALNENGPCNPQEGEWCDGDFICDASNTPGVCVSESQANDKLKEWTYQDHKIIGTAKALAKLKTALKKKPEKRPEKRPERKRPLPDPYSAEGLRRMGLIGKLAGLTGKHGSLYKDWHIAELISAIEDIEISPGPVLVRPEEETKREEKERRHNIIEQITRITGENKKKYRTHSLEQVIQKLDDLLEERGIEEMEIKEKADLLERIRRLSGRPVSETIQGLSIPELDELVAKLESEEKEKGFTVEEEVKIPVFDPEDIMRDRKELIREASELSGQRKRTYKGKNVDEMLDIVENLRREQQQYLQQIARLTEGKVEERIFNLSNPALLRHIQKLEEDVRLREEVEEVKLPLEAKEILTEEEETDIDSESESEEEQKRPIEGAEIVDVEATLANVIAGGRKIGELAKVQQSILKCLGLLS